MSADLLQITRHIEDDEAAAVIYAPGQYPDIEMRVRVHVGNCEPCAGRISALQAADRKAAELLSILDKPSPTVSETAIVAAATRAQRQRGAGRGRRAAAVIASISLAAAAAAAVPASPLHRFVLRALGSASSSQRLAAPSSPAATAPGLPGVFMSTDSTLDVVFLRRNTRGLIHVHVVAGQQASLTSADKGSSYRVGTARIVVDQAMQASFDLVLPRSLRHARIWVGGNLVLERRNGALGGDPANFAIDLYQPETVKPTQ